MPNMTEDKGLGGTDPSDQTLLTERPEANSFNVSSFAGGAGVQVACSVICSLEQSYHLVDTLECSVKYQISRQIYYLQSYTLNKIFPKTSVWISVWCLSDCSVS